jgi:Domain of unknown function (DUF4190)
MSAEPQFSLQWRGKSYGPWTYAQIQEQLMEGQIHSLYQIRVDAVWMPLRDHIEQTEAAALKQQAADRAARIRQQEAEKVVQVRPRGRGHIAGPIKRPDPFANPPPVFVKGASPEVMPTMDYSHTDISPTCWLAVAAFVVSCCSFVPYLNLVSWLPSLVLGHLALAQIRREPSMEGRGLALGALVIAYFMLVFAAVSFLFIPDLFYRIFPIAG